jgi:hypothetical protein
VGLGVDREKSLLWEHRGQALLLRLVHVDGTLIGINLMGLRYRHVVCERWIEEGRDVDYVIEHLSEANFDPEFSARHEAEIRAELGSQWRRQQAEVAA